MSTVVSNELYSSGIPTAGVLTVPLSKPTRKISFTINTLDSTHKFEATLVGKPVVTSDSFTAEFSVDANVKFILDLKGKRIEGEDKFQSGQYYLGFRITKPTPRAHFIAATLMAVFALAGAMEIPELSDSPLIFDLPLIEISNLLHRRQTAYRLMVIEQATEKQILLPSTTTSAVNDAITLVYRAIVDRSFVWPSGEAETFIYATEESRLALLTSDNAPSIYRGGIKTFSETILGQTISLGRASVTIPDAIIRDLDKVKRELAQADGQPINVVIQSLSGQVEYEFPDAPRLPDAPWDSKVQTFIDMEAQLDAALIQQYHALAAATLEGLTEEEKAEITTPSNIGEAFLIDDSKVENMG